MKEPPPHVFVTFCPHCGRVACALTAEDKKHDRIVAGTCEFCPTPARGRRMMRFVRYRVAP